MAGFVCSGVGCCVCSLVGVSVAVEVDVGGLSFLLAAGDASSVADAAVLSFLGLSAVEEPATWLLGFSASPFSEGTGETVLQIDAASAFFFFLRLRGGLFFFSCSAAASSPCLLEATSESLSASSSACEFQ
jgi:hypothetical protein